MRYAFNDIDKCNMCESPTISHKILGRRLSKSQGKNPRKKKGITTTVCQCSNCGLIYANPLPIPFDIQDHYGIPPEEYWKEEYFELDDNYFKGEVQHLKELIDVKPGMKYLDIGAGLGKQMKVLEKHGFDVFGIEPSKPFYERAIERMGVPKDRLKLCAIEEAEFPEEHFDFISFGVVLEHIYDPSSAIKKALKWLKNDGLVHIEVPSSKWLTHRIINTYYKLRRMDYVGNISPMHEPFHLYEFALESFKRNAEILGYEIVLSEYYVCETHLPKKLDFLIKPIMNKTKTGMQLCVWLKKKQ